MASSFLHAWGPVVTEALPEWLVALGAATARECAQMCGAWLVLTPPDHALRIGYPEAAGPPQLPPLLVPALERPLCPMLEAAMRTAQATGLVPLPAPPAAVVAGPAAGGGGGGAAAASPAAVVAGVGVPVDDDQMNLWSVGALAVTPEPFNVPLLASSLAQARLDNATERAAATPSSKTPSTIVADPFTRLHYSRLHLTYTAPEHDTIPRKMVASVLDALGELAVLVTCLTEAVTADPHLVGLLQARVVQIRERIPDREIVGLATGAADPTCDQVIDRIAEIIHIVRGRMLLAGHFPNALTAFRATGIDYLTGTAERIDLVQAKSYFAHHYEQKYTHILPGTTPRAAPVVFRPIANALVDSSEARLSALTLTPTAWPSRDRLIQHHWRWYWHQIVRAGLDSQKAQHALAARVTHVADTRRALGNGKNARSDTPPPSAPPAKTPPPKQTPKDDAAKPVKDRSRTPSPVPAAKVPLTGPVTCKAPTGCRACGVRKDEPHTATCSWLAKARAAQTDGGGSSAGAGAGAPP